MCRIYVSFGMLVPGLVSAFRLSLSGNAPLRSCLWARAVGLRWNQQSLISLNQYVHLLPFNQRIYLRPPPGGDTLFRFAISPFSMRLLVSIFAFHSFSLSVSPSLSRPRCPVPGPVSGGLLFSALPQNLHFCCGLEITEPWSVVRCTRFRVFPAFVFAVFSRHKIKTKTQTTATEKGCVWEAVFAGSGSM